MKRGILALVLLAAVLSLGATLQPLLVDGLAVAQPDVAPGGIVG